MTPAQADTPAAPSSPLLRRAVMSPLVTRICARLVDREQWIRLQVLSDLFVLYLGASFALFADTPPGAIAPSRWSAGIFPLVVFVMMRVRRAPDERLDVSLIDTFAYVLAIVSLAAMLAISVDSILGGDYPLRLAPRLWLFAVVYLGIARVVLVSVRRQAMRNRALATPTLIVGAGLIGTQIVRRLIEHPTYGLRPVGFLDANPLPVVERSGASALPIIGSPDDLPDAVQQTGARHIILAFSGERDGVLVDRVRQCEQLGVGVSLVPRLYEAINERTTLDHVGGIPLLTLHSTDPRGWQFAIKHTIDRTAALAGLISVAPIMAVAAVAVRLSSPGPILFRQRRIGRDGREFDVVKFRTMRVSEEPDPSFRLPPGVAPGGVEGEDRRTRVGRVLRDLSLDELPQLFNVLRGDMSLVGPRPERPEYVARFSRDVLRYEDRHRVKSGITGWAQVNGLRGQTSIADRVEWDNWYIQNWSLRLDLRILALTIAEILRFRG